LAAGDGAGAEAAMRQLLTVHPEVERVVPAPREH
ncbi:GntR family transcriptional regulator, partial [Streptomyces sp. S6]